VNDNCPSWRNDNSTAEHGSSNDHGAASANAAGAMDAAGADNRTCIHGAQGDEACCQQ
jgi:hypothetical protein